MRAWQLIGANQPLRLIECDDPQPGPGEVVIDVRAAGLCHSDVGFLDGTLTPLLPKLPIIPGHEVAGVVAAVGAGVADFQPGERVAIESGKAGAPGWASDGGFAAKCRTSAKTLVRLSERGPSTRSASAVA